MVFGNATILPSIPTFEQPSYLKNLSLQHEEITGIITSLETLRFYIFGFVWAFKSISDLVLLWSNFVQIVWRWAQVLLERLSTIFQLWTHQNWHMPLPLMTPWKVILNCPIYYFFWLVYCVLETRGQWPYLPVSTRAIKMWLDFGSLGTASEFKSDPRFEFSDHK